MNSVKIADVPATRKSIKAVIFDCDGTLVDSEEPGLDVLHELACGEGLRMTREQASEQFRGVRMAECIAWVASQLTGKPPSFETDFMSQVRAVTEARFRQGLDPLPGAHELLGKLPIPFCVATNGPREKVELTLELTGLRPLFGNRIFSAYEVGSFKPEPGLFLHAASALGVAPEYCAVVEDSLPGIQAGLAAGMTVFALRDQASLPAAIAEQVICIGNLGELGPHFPDRIGDGDFPS
jgi:HAD superfamily hydrolase (TIGR01509 family)